MGLSGELSSPVPKREGPGAPSVDDQLTEIGATRQVKGPEGPCSFRCFYVVPPGLGELNGPFPHALHPTDEGLSVGTPVAGADTKGGSTGEPPWLFLLLYTVAIQREIIGNVWRDYFRG